MLLQSIGENRELIHSALIAPQIEREKFHNQLEAINPLLWAVVSISIKFPWKIVPKLLSDHKITFATEGISSQQKVAILLSNYFSQNQSNDRAAMLAVMNDLIAAPNARYEKASENLKDFMEDSKEITEEDFIEIVDYMYPLTNSHVSILQVACARRNDLRWSGHYIPYLALHFGGIDFPLLSESEERFYATLLWNTPESIIEQLKHDGAIPQMKLGDFLKCLLKADLSNFTDVRIEILGALRYHYQRLEGILLDSKEKNILSELSYQAAKKYFESSDLDLAVWFYQQISCSSCKYVEGLKELLDLYKYVGEHRNQDPYQLAVSLRRKIKSYNSDLEKEDETPEIRNQKEIMQSLLCQIEDLRTQSKKESFEHSRIILKAPIPLKRIREDNDKQQVEKLLKIFMQIN
jgi:hypothetical protein